MSPIEPNMHPTNSPTRTYSSESNRGTADEMKEKFQDVEQKAVEKYEETKNFARQKYSALESYIKETDMKKAVQDVRSFAARKPLTAMGIGVGAGFLISRAFGRRS